MLTERSARVATAVKPSSRKARRRADVFSPKAPNGSGGVGAPEGGTGYSVPEVAARHELLLAAHEASSSIW